MKAILELDMPVNCIECPLCIFGYCAPLNGKKRNVDILDRRMPECPLKPKEE